MTPSIARKSSKFRESQIRRLFAEVEKMRARGEDVYFLSAGQPGIPPDEELVEYMMKIVLSGRGKVFRYSPSRGLPTLLEAISRDLKKYGKIDVPSSNILVTTGASEAIYVAILALVKERREAVIFDPTYVIYRDTLEFVGAKIKRIPEHIENEFQPSEEAIREALSNKTSVVIITTPDNPTGRILDESRAKLIVDLAREYDFWIIADEAYKHMVYEGEHLWLSKLDPDRVISINSFSKDAAIPGLRLGYVYGPKRVIRRLEKIRQHITLCPPTLPQYIAEYYLESGIKERYLKKVLPIYRRRRDILFDNLVSGGLIRAFKPPAGMFIFADVRSATEALSSDDRFFAERLLHEMKVSVVPGSSFGEVGRGFIRLSFVSENEERLKIAADKIKEFINKISG